MKRRSSLKQVIVFGLVFGATQGWGWGELGHRIVGEVAANISSKHPIWKSNEVALGKLANVPDKNWKSGKSSAKEKPTHYFEPDAYFNLISDFNKFPRAWVNAKSKFGEKTLVEHGTAVWRVQQLMAIATKSLIAGDFKDAVEIAGTMSHYVGDLSQPLHVTTNYDGQDTNQNGIHSYFETTNLNARDYQKMKAEVVLRANALLRDVNFIKENSGTPEEKIFNLVTRSYSHLEEVLEIDQEKGRMELGAELQYEIALDRMADGAATLALFFQEISKNSGIDPTQGQSLAVTVPTWIAPNYDNPTQRARAIKAKSLSFFNPTQEQAFEQGYNTPSFKDCF